MFLAVSTVPLIHRIASYTPAVPDRLETLAVMVTASPVFAAGLLITRLEVSIVATGAAVLPVMAKVEKCEITTV